MLTCQKPTINDDWQSILANGISDPLELLRLLDIEPSSIPDLSLNNPFALRVPRGYVAKMKKGDVNDPLLRQVLPLQAELTKHPQYTLDPLQEHKANPVSGLLHKYQSRVLLTVTGHCAINCRYCFRRHFPYADNNPGSKGWDKAIEYISNNPDINEVIFSGGDPLLANDKSLSQLTRLISEVSHVTTLRIHTRFPLVIPERITPALIDWLCGTRLQPVMVFHCNHPQELDAKFGEKAAILQKNRVTLLNQSVLLKDINDNPTTLVNLSKQLFKMGILPYYLHLLDKVEGALHFDISTAKALQIHQALLEQLPGYLVPKLVKEESLQRFKTPVF